MQMCSVSVAADVCQRAVLCRDRGRLVFACGEIQAEVEATERVSLLALCSGTGGVWLWRPEGHLQS